MPRAYSLGARATAVAATRQRILAAAIDTFGEEGFTGASVDQIAERADVSRATVYHHFGSKLGLLEALVEDAATQAHLPDVVELGERAETPDELHDLLRAFAGFWSRNETLFRNVIGLSAFDPDVAKIVDVRDQTRRAGLAGLVDRLAHHGAIASQTPRDLVTDGLWVLTSFAVFDQLHRRSGLDVEQTAQMLIRFADSLLVDASGIPTTADSDLMTSSDKEDRR